MSGLVANARMYSVTPAAAQRWKDLFGWMARASGVEIAAIDHVFPAALPDLWRRPDLGAGFVCGFPFTQSFGTLQPVAVPVAARGPAAGTTRYATQLVVAASSPFARIEDTFGHRIGYTVADSQSGFNAVCHHLEGYWRPGDPPLYREVIGPLVTPRAVLQAVLVGGIDVGPLDSYALDLMLAAAPELAGEVRIVATTRPMPAPFLAAHADCPPEIVARLTEALTGAADDAEAVPLLDALLIAGFAPVDVAAYAEIVPADPAVLLGLNSATRS